MNKGEVTGIVDIVNLDVIYAGDVHAVEELSFSVSDGESYGIVGESGSGKSTVLRAICGLAPTSGGSISVGGEQLPPKRRAADFYRSVQMIFQDPYGSLHPRQTIDQALSEPLSIHRFDNREVRIRNALDEVGLGTRFRFRFPHQLSGGQRQRVSIARALILEPKILLLDEPTSALDASIQAEVLNLLDRIRSERKLTYLLVSHDLAVVAHMCDRLLVMQNGKAVENLTREKLRLKSPQKAYTRDLLKASEGFQPSSQEKA